MAKDLFKCNIDAIRKRLPLWNVGVEDHYVKTYGAVGYYEWVDQAFPKVKPHAVCTALSEETEEKLRNNIRLFLETPGSGITLEGEFKRVMNGETRFGYVKCLMDLGYKPTKDEIMFKYYRCSNDERGLWFSSDFHEISAIRHYYEEQAGKSLIITPA
jgi:hypothetical protein